MDFCWTLVLANLANRAKERFETLVKGVDILSVPEHQVLIFRLRGYVQSSALAKEWVAFLDFHPEAAAFHQLGDWRQFVGMVSVDDLRPVRLKRIECQRALGIDGNFEPNRAVLTNSGPEGDAFFQSYKLIIRLDNLTHCTSPESAWKALALDAVIPRSVRKFLG